MAESSKVAHHIATSRKLQEKLARPSEEVASRPPKEEPQRKARTVTSSLRVAPELEGYEKETGQFRECFLDGRYFSQVFRNYPGLNPTPVRIRYFHEEGHIRRSVTSTLVAPPAKVTSITRVIIEYPSGLKHAAVLLINFWEKKAVWFDPHSAAEIEDIRAEHLAQVTHDFLRQVIGPDIQLYNESRKVVEIPPGKGSQAKCDRVGFCNAYVILFTWAYLNEIPLREEDYLNPQTILKFAQRVTETQELPVGPPEVEYLIGGLALGLLGGTALGLGLGYATAPRYYYPVPYPVYM